MDPILSCLWQDQDGEWALTVSHHDDGWELVAAAPHWSESLPFTDRDEVRRLAQALLDLPADPEPYECEWHLSRSESDGSEGEHTHYATFAVGLDPTDDHRPYLAYQSYYHRGHGAALGLEVICEDPPVDQLRAQARAFLAGLRDDPPRRP
ncbi:hypothetical protein ACFYUY_11040 [Kitasatospora sp. NPDC004745]|uniref:hypothetical protein n=1 Tax=unclassified Kitasatospora TaxID=2633591 RepID=UPI0034056249